MRRPHPDHTVPRFIVGSLAALISFTAGCDEVSVDNIEGAGAELVVAIAPMTYLDASDACFSLAVYDSRYTPGNAQSGLVWEADSICGSQYGANAEITYIGPCVAGETHTVVLTLDALYETPNTARSGPALGPSDYNNPCPANRPCTRPAPCTNNSDTLVEFNLTVMRAARQGFFDIAVNFEDIFCSAKTDCQYAGGAPIKLLHNPREAPSERDDTVVVAFACTTGTGDDTTLHMDDISVVCGTAAGAYEVARIDPASGPGNLLNYTPHASGVTLFAPPSAVPDEKPPRLWLANAPAGYGPDSWRGPAAGAGHKTNWHARYLADGDGLTRLFGARAATLTVGDIASIGYSTFRPAATPAGRDWWIQIYTRPVPNLPVCANNALPPTCNLRSWYHNRYINDYGTHSGTGAWVTYTTGTTAGAMTFKGLTWGDFVAAHGAELVEMVSVQTDSGWGGFDGAMDGLEITLTGGAIGRVDFASALFQAQVSMGAEQLQNLGANPVGPANKVYWAVALGLDRRYGLKSGECRVVTAMTASNGGDLRWETPGTSYPRIAVSLPLTWDDKGLTCGAHGLDGAADGRPDPVIQTGYSPSGVTYPNCLLGNFPATGLDGPPPPTFCAVPTVRRGFSGETGAASRVRAQAGGAELFLGSSDLGVAANRVEVNYDRFATDSATQVTPYAFVFSWKATTRTVSLSIDGPGDDPLVSLTNAFTGGPPNKTYNATSCPIGSWNAMQISLRDSLTTGLVALRGLDLNGWSLGDLDQGTLTNVTPTLGTTDWMVEQFDFNQDFTLKGDLLTWGFQGSQESLRFDFRLKCVTPTP